MLQSERQPWSQIHQWVDAALFGLALWIAHFVRSTFFPDARIIEPFEAFLWLWLLILPLTPVVLEAQGFYNRPLMGPRRETGWQLLKGSAVITMIVIGVMFLLKMNLARSVILLFGLAGFGLVFLKEELVRLSYTSPFSRRQLRRRFLLVGTAEDTQELKLLLERSRVDWVEIVAELDLNQTSVDRLVHLLHEHAVNGVLLSAQHTYFGQLEQTILACEIEGVEAWLMADFFKTQISRTSVEQFAGRPVVVFRSAPEASWQGVAKQVIDVLGAFCLLILTAPILILAALAVRISSPGPVLFRQKRCGLNGRPFTMYKFRSMVTDAEQRKQELEAFNEMSGPVFKVSQDPRITPVGRFLRRYSIDELPQLVNVLLGDMSPVGPRPLPVEEVRRFDDLAHRRRLSVKPGLTCLWQISGRNQVCDFKEWVRLDLEYIDNWSLWLDLRILLQTIPAVLVGTGAK